MSGRISPQIIRPAGWVPNYGERFALNRDSMQAQGLHAWYPMAEGSGLTVRNWSGKAGLDVTMQSAGMTPGWGFGEAGTCLSLAQTTGLYGNITDAVDPTEYTLAAWVNASAWEGTILARTNSTPAGAAWSHQIGINGAGKAYHYWFDASAKTVTSTSGFTVRWFVHIVGTIKNGGNGRLYVNGVEEGTPLAATIIWTGGDRWSFANKGGASIGSWGGQIFDVRIYHREFSAAEVRHLYDPQTRYELYYPLGRRVWFIPTGGTTNNLSVSGSITPAGALVKQDGKALSGAVTPAGAATKQANKSASGSVAPSGSVVRSFASALAGAITPSGALAKVFSSTMSGSITPSGTLDALRTALLSLAGSLGLSGALARRASKGLTGSVTPAGGLAKRIGKLLSGTIAAAGAVVTSLTSPTTKVTVTLSDEAVTVASVSDELGG